jgi:hypothetical protein
LAAVLFVAVVLTNLPRRQEVVEPTYTRVAIAREDIEPYTIISPSQVGLSADDIPESEAARYYRTAGELAGLMATRFIKAGQMISLAYADTLENVRYVEDMQLEIVSFPAVFNEMVAGQVRPGHKVNIYGYQRKTGQESVGDLVLVASRVWVVDVRTAGGDPVGEEEAESQEQQQLGGFLSVPGAGPEEEPASVLTIAAAPEVVQDIIRALGAQGYSAWVTLAPAGEYVGTPVPLATPVPTPTIAPTLLPGVSPTLGPVPSPEAITGMIYMSHSRDGEKQDTFQGGVVTVWAIADLDYSPAGLLPVHLEVHDEDGELVFEDDDVHPGPGRESYMISRAGGFAADTRYTTTLYAGGREFKAEWRTVDSTSPLPNTGGAPPIPGSD